MRFSNGALMMAGGLAVVALYVTARQAMQAAGNAIDTAIGDAVNWTSEAIAPVADRVWSTDLVSVPDAAKGGHPSQGDVRRFDNYIRDYGSPLANLPNAYATWVDQTKAGTSPINFM